MESSEGPILLDCTLRDGGYYNAWDFPKYIVEEYLQAVKAAEVDVVEIGFRFLKNEGFKGPCAYTTDEYLRSLNIPKGLTISVMLNGSDLCTDLGCESALERLFPEAADTSPVDLVRIACHFQELRMALPATEWLAERGFRVGLNLMQIADRTQKEVSELTHLASKWPIDVLYFADSMGSMKGKDVAKITDWLKEGWSGPIGIHTHDNMGLALSNTLRAHAEGVHWLDSTVTGMGRGPGNARTEELAIEAETLRKRRADLVLLMALIRQHFGPMKIKHGWGTNPFYYLAGKYGIHPTYIQQTISDSRYGEEDILAIINHLRNEGGKKFSGKTLDEARNFYTGPPSGSWKPKDLIAGREVLILATGPGIAAHRPALELYIQRTRPIVIALNTQSAINAQLIDLRIACHPVRLLADAKNHTALPQPLITPASMLPSSLRTELQDKELLDFGIGIKAGSFEFHDTYCIAPTSLVLSYSLAVATSGQASRILMAGFDGYPKGDPRNDETDAVLTTFSNHAEEKNLISITPTCHRMREASVYSQEL